MCQVSKKRKGQNQIPRQKSAVKPNSTQSSANLRALLQQGMALFQRGRLQEAERAFQSVLSIDSKNINALQLLGIINFQSGRCKEGEQLLRRAIKQAPNIADLHFNLGNMLEQQGKLEQASIAFENAVKLGMRGEQAHNNLGMVLSKLGRLDEAESSLRKAMDINPKNPSALSNYGLLLRKQDKSDEAIKILEQAIAVEPRFVDAYSNLGTICFENGELSKAEGYLRKAMNIDAQNANIMSGLAGVLINRNEDAAALELLQNAVKLRPENVDINLNLAKALVKLEDDESAIEVYKRIEKYSPDNIYALTGMGGMLSKQGKFSDAEECFQKVVEIDSDNIAGRVGMLSIATPDTGDDGVRYLEEVYPGLEDAEAKTSVAFCLGKVFEKGGDYSKAFSYFAEGNSLKRSGYDYTLDEDKEFFSSIKEVFTGGFFQEQSGCGAEENIPIFILGMPRSGTTLTEQILSSHSQVYGAGELPDLRKQFTQLSKEREYKKFPEFAKRLTVDDLTKMGKDYIDGLRERASSAERVTDKMPHNFLHVGMIRLMLPNAKIIHCKRDPIDNCLSIFKQNFGGVHKYAYEQTELGRYHLLYQDLMEHWNRVLPGFMFELQYEEMVADQEGMTRKLLEFCELPWDDNCLHFHKSERTVKTASYTQVRKKMYSDSVQLWKRYEQELQLLISAINDKEES
jgi:tetratricopeptide (TPR) repeat protein